MIGWFGSAQCRKRLGCGVPLAAEMPVNPCEPRPQKPGFVLSTDQGIPWAFQRLGGVTNLTDGSCPLVQPRQSA